MTHHLLVQYCNFVVRGTYVPTTEYAILGDDVVIFDSLIARHYYELMSKLGLQINLTKSVVDPTGSSIEFAKRRFVGRVEITGIPFPLLDNADKSIYDYHTLLRSMKNWGFPINLSEGFSLVPPYLSNRGKGLLAILCEYTALSESHD